MQSAITVEISTIVTNEAVKLMHKHTVIIHKCMQNHRENTHKSLHNYTMAGTPSTPPRHIQRGSRKKKRKGRKAVLSVCHFLLYIMGGGVPGRPGYQWNIGVGGTTRVSNPQKKVHQILTHGKNFSKYKKGPARALF